MDHIIRMRMFRNMSILICMRMCICLHQNLWNAVFIKSDNGSVVMLSDMKGII